MSSQAATHSLGFPRRAARPNPLPGVSCIFFGSVVRPRRTLPALRGSAIPSAVSGEGLAPFLLNAVSGERAYQSPVPRGG